MKNIKNMTLMVLLAVLIFTFSFCTEANMEKDIVIQESILDSLPCVQMFNSIEKYSEQYNIPKRYAYGIAYKETHYEGPFHWKYTHMQTGIGGTEGPMQVMPSTAKLLFPGRKITAKELRSNIDFNVHCSMKLLRRLHNKYGNWKTTFGAYNTGKPLVNNYALYVFNYKRK